MLPGRPGDVCGTERRWECRAGRLVCDAAPDRNRCGGESRLASDPGASCGDCGGVTVCVSREETACVGARPRNECGGCASLTVAGVPFADTPGAPCGLCDTGTYECTSAEEVACLGEDLDALRLFYADRDADEWGSTTETRLSCTPLFGYTRVTGDCADLSFERHPEAPELCNGFDDDCDGVVDEGYLSYADGDGDGYSSGTDPQTDCVVPEGRTRLLGDCDDTDDRAFPGQTIAFETERNSGGFDFDCDGVVTLSWDNLSSCTVQLPPCADLGEEATPVPRRGWTSRVPECGRAANYSQTCVDFGAGCVPGEIVVRTQTCL
ncbi:MAG: putative metal-binding motif-containing protein [Myxococcales bacterium]|nr:putative metal-binding motif-containing protein [Myxococcales bacterium]MCB9520246.1 putative metal-binding motif-containing protein [Myxococcales bacterium]MCB9531386.1 putative metal-binding motif-containing protein [Myxococcales bacterium]MCB9533541.1 putative metal-binding motif-containing protein [Myxococcales bacterium]